MNIGQILEAHLGWAASKLDFRAVTPVFDGANEREIQAELARAWLIDRAWQEIGDTSWDWIKEQGYYEEEAFQDDDEVRQIYLENWLGDKDYDLDLVATDLTYARRATLNEWLREREIDPAQVVAFDNEGVSIEQREEHDDAAIAACLRLWCEANGKKTGGLKPRWIFAIWRQK